MIFILTNAAFCIFIIYCLIYKIVEKIRKRNGYVEDICKNIKFEDIKEFFVGVYTDKLIKIPKPADISDIDRYYIQIQDFESLSTKLIKKRRLDSIEIKIKFMEVNMHSKLVFVKNSGMYPPTSKETYKDYCGCTTVELFYHEKYNKNLQFHTKDEITELIWQNKERLYRNIDNRGFITNKTTYYHPITGPCDLLK